MYIYIEREREREREKKKKKKQQKIREEIYCLVLIYGLMPCQPSWVIHCHGHPCRRIAAVLSIFVSKVNVIA